MTLDKRDERAKLGSRAAFPNLPSSAYLAYAAISPVSVPVRHAVARVLASYSVQGVEAFPTWLAQRDQLRGKLARLLGCGSEELGLVPNTTAGVQAIALGLDWKPGERVLLFQGEFPTNVTPWQTAARLFDLKLEWSPLELWLDQPEEAFSQFEELLKSGIRLVAVSAVQFQTGLRMPLEQMGALCKRYGAELFVDAIQCLGVVPLDVKKANIDYLACGSHKWLMALEGAGFVYVSKDKVGRLRPRTVGWLSHEDPVSFLFEGPGLLRYDRELKQGAEVFEAGAPNTAGFAALEASLDLLQAIGIPAIQSHVSGYLDALEPEVQALGFVSQRRAHGRSGILSFRPPPDIDLPRLVARLSAAGIVTTRPDGYLRFAPHWPNSLDEVPKVVSALRAAI